MNASDLRTVRALPLSSARWEVGLEQVPMRIDGVDLEGLLLVAEEGTGLVRGAGPVPRGDDLWTTLRGAFLEPPPPTVPSRPRALLCTDPALARRLESATAGLDLKVVLVDRVPAVDEAISGFAEHLTPVSGVGISVELPVYRATLDTLCRLAPWDAVSDAVTFRFTGPGLEGAVALVIGRSGEQQGVVLYPSEAGYQATLAHLRHGGPLEDVEALNLYLHPVGEVDRAHQAEGRALDLVLPGDRMPRVVVLREVGLEAATEREQRVLLAAIEGVVGLCLGDPRLLELEPRTREVRTCLGRVTVTSTPPVPTGPVTLLDFAHAAVGVGRTRDESRPSVLVKLTKRDAERLARMLEGADAIAADAAGGDRVRLRLWAGPRELGVLCVTPGEPDTLPLFERSATAMLVIVGGGPTRTPRDKDVVAMLDLAVRRSAADRGRHDAVFDRPIAEWPKVSETLVRFAAGAFGPELGTLPETALRETMKVVETVWNACVLADYGGDAGHLQEVRRLAATAPDGPSILIEKLLREKSARFAGDPRIVRLRVERVRGEPRVFADASLPRGYPVGLR